MYTDYSDSKSYIRQKKERQEKRFIRLVSPLLQDERAKQMRKFIQHGDITTYDHVLRVARLSYRIAGGLPFSFHEKEMITGALLHDYFLYDWHNKGDHLHGFHHPRIAAENAKRDFHISKMEEDIILSHMWPLNLTCLPRTREAVVVCVADKICSLQETLRGTGRPGT